VFDCLASYKAQPMPTLVNPLESITYHFYPMIFVLPKCYLRLQKCYLCYLLLLSLVLSCFFYLCARTRSNYRANFVNSYDLYFLVLRYRLTIKALRERLRASEMG
jgi:hypothetical protein